MKMKYLKTEDGRDYSYFKVSQFEVQDLIDILNTLTDEIGKVKPGQLVPRLANSPFKDEEDRQEVTLFKLHHKPN